MTEDLTCVSYSKVWYLVAQRKAGSWRAQSGREAGGIPDSSKSGGVGISPFWRLWKSLIDHCQKTEGGKFIIHVSSSYVSLNIGCKLLSRPDTELHGLLVLSTVTALTFLWFRIPQLSWLFLCDATRCDSWLLDHLWSIVRSSEDLEVFSTTLFIKLFPIHICVALSPNVLNVHDTFCSLLTKPFTSKRGNYFLSNLQCVHRCIYTHNEAPICRTGK